MKDAPMARYIVLVSAILLLIASFTHAADELKTAVADAVAKGQKYLKAARAAGNGFGSDGEAALTLVGGNGWGTVCLTGLALVESGLDAKDPTVAALARAVRQSPFNTRSTYEISLIIMFLDRLGSRDDDGIIQFLTLRLMSGQTTDGTWGYTCDGLNLDPVQARQLHAELTRGSKLATPLEKPRPKKETKPRDDLDPKTPAKEPEPKESPTPEPKPSSLHPSLEKYAKGIRPGGQGGQGTTGFPGLLLGSGDHSNTQFATVALWCGRRRGVDVSAFLAATDKHYRDVQSRDGGWSYTKSATVSSTSMTCAGLMGLAMGIGSKNVDGKGGVKIDPEVIAQDRAVDSGLKYLGTFLKAAGQQRDGQSGGYLSNELSNDLYFMWSLERVGMVYGLQTIGSLDWYDWGARILVTTQDKTNGAWGNHGGQYGSAENATAFALLFLSRSNLANEVSTSMTGKIKDPGTSRLIGGGDLAKIIGESGQGKSGSKRPGPTVPAKVDTPPPATETDKGGKLAAALIGATAIERADLLTKYRDSKGGEYTDALARAATKMTGEAQAQVREALAQRLTRMVVSTLNDFMKDGDRELRRSAALAAGSKPKERIGELAPTLIRLIGDDEAMVVQAARASLRALSSGQDFGPETGSAPGERGKALIAWRGWWESQKK